MNKAFKMIKRDFSFVEKYFLAKNVLSLLQCIYMLTVCAGIFFTKSSSSSAFVHRMSENDLCCIVIGAIYGIQSVLGITGVLAQKRPLIILFLIVEIVFYSMQGLMVIFMTYNFGVDFIATLDYLMAFFGVYAAWCLIRTMNTSRTLECSKVQIMIGV
jgi:hypothetical protein